VFFTGVCYICLNFQSGLYRYLGSSWYRRFLNYHRLQHEAGTTQDAVEAAKAGVLRSCDPSHLPDLHHLPTTLSEPQSADQAMVLLVHEPSVPVSFQKMFLHMRINAGTGILWLFLFGGLFRGARKTYRTPYLYFWLKFSHKYNFLDLIIRQENYCTALIPVHPAMDPDSAQLFRLVRNFLGFW
jgi:hypothetical protein